MRSIIMLAAFVALMLGFAGQVQADNLYDKLFANCVPNCIKAKQCDDYCPKGLPCTKPVCQSQSDDYCPKQLPCTSPVCAASCDDYCAKPLPKVCCCPQSRTATPCQVCERQSGSPAAVVGAGQESRPQRRKSDSAGAVIITKQDQFVVPQPVKQARIPKSESKSGEFDYFR